MNVDSKTCELCGRTIEPRKKWLKNWDQVKYCSEKCRRSKKATNYEGDILQLLQARGAGKTICPSEVLSEGQKQDKAIMELVRQSARRLVAKQQIEIMQKGKIVDPSSAKGPIRLKLKTKGF